MNTDILRSTFERWDMDSALLHLSDGYVFAQRNLFNGQIENECHGKDVDGSRGQRDGLLTKDSRSGLLYENSKSKHYVKVSKLSQRDTGKSNMNMPPGSHVSYLSLNRSN